jgi:kinesin family protein 13
MPPPPEWVVVGESVLIRPYNTSGVIGFVGPTHFQVSTNDIYFLKHES